MSERESTPQTVEQVKMARQILEGLGLEIAKPDEVRDILASQGTRQGDVFKRELPVHVSGYEIELESERRRKNGYGHRC